MSERSVEDWLSIVQSRLLIVILAGLSLINLNTSIAETTEPAVEITKTVEQRLAELEQKQKILERKLEIEREETEAVKTALAKSQSEVEALKKAQKPQIAVPDAGTVSQLEADKPELEKLIDERIDAKKADFASPEWVKNLQIKGDFLYRNEWADDESKSTERNRNRIRARVGVYGKASEEFDYGLRIAGGQNNSPTSRNQDLGTSFTDKDVWLDLAYFDYHPKAVEGLDVLGGKIANPYYTVGNSDLMFDTDVNPEGIAAKYSAKISDDTEFFSSAGGFYVEERETEAETSLWGLQGGIKHTFDEKSGKYATVGGGYYDYGNLQGTKLSSSSTNFFGNSTSGGNFASDFDIVQGFAEYGFKVKEIPVKLFSDYVKNAVSATGKDAAYLAGLTVGSNKNKGDWQFGYNYRDVEADSLVGIFTEATFGGGGTDVKGHKLSAGYQLAKNVSLGTSYMAAQRTRNDVTTDHDVVFFDVSLKF